MDFYTIFRSRCLVADGALGTYYREKYGDTRRAPELDNLADPCKIETIHREYIKAGADILRTNSFASNVRTLCPDRAGKMTRDERLKTVYDNVSAACRIAKTAVKQEQTAAAEEGRIFSQRLHTLCRG